jgi:acetyl esterase/lipase
MQKLVRPFVLLLVSVVLTPVLVTRAADVEVIPDVIYGHKDGMALTFDVLRPKIKPNGAAVIFMVSGGWVSTYAPPEQSIERFKDLLDKGFTVIPVRHGSSPKYFIPEIVGDVRRAVRFIRFNASKWGIDPNRLGVFGGSAGGHLSLVLGTASDAGDPGAKEPFLKETDRVASVVAYFPPVDLRPLARGVRGTPPADGRPERFPALNFEKEKAADFSPIVHVSADDPPTLLIHGDKDDLVPISNSKIIYEAFKSNNVKTDFITIEGAGHGFRGEDSKPRECSNGGVVRTDPAEANLSRRSLRPCRFHASHPAASNMEVRMKRKLRCRYHDFSLTLSGHDAEPRSVAGEPPCRPSHSATGGGGDVVRKTCPNSGGDAAVCRQGLVPGVVTLVARKGRVVHLEAIGYRDVESKTPMTTDTIFRIASMTKPIASVALMSLYEEGRFLLSDPISKFSTGICQDERGGRTRRA